MASFIALYHGDTIGSANLIATSADPKVVREFADRLLAERDFKEGDRVLRELEGGRRRALQLVRGESDD